MKRLQFLIITALLIFVSVNTALAQDQNVKSYFKTGKLYIESKDYESGIENMTEVINLDPKYLEAYLLRALAYEKVDSIVEAIDDLNNYTSLSVKKDYEVYFNLARLNNKIEDYESALKNATEAIELKKSFLPAYHQRTLALVKLESFEDALRTCDAALSVKKTRKNYLYKAMVLYLTENYKSAIDNYKLALEEDPEYMEAFIGKAKCFYELNILVAAKDNIEEALQIDENCKECLLTRSKIFYKMVKHQEAINDLSRLLILYPEDPDLADIYFLRGTYYKDFNKNMDGINDFTEVLANNPEYLEAYYNRASLFMRIENKESAVQDLDSFISKSSERHDLVDMTIEAEIMLHELRRESEPPTVQIIVPVERISGTLDIKRDETTTEVYGKLVDANDILYMKVNGEKVNFNKDEATGDVTFSYNLDLTYFSKLSIDVADVYYNQVINEYDFRRIEADKPLVHIFNPYCPDGNSLSISSGLNEIVIEGGIEDVSTISSITIDSIYDASYNKSEANPSFFCLVDITNKNSIEISVEDYYGNVTIQKFFLNRGAIVNYDDNPMGNTWAFFIENSNYDDFIALEGPKRDVNKMKSVLESNYKVNNISVKRNLTKEGLDRFFSIELRELVNKHDINSVFIWYAGHGQLIDKVGYWIPTDAKKDDEFSYYSLNSLKSSMEVYSDDLTHLLIVSDACESGPTFYEVMRSVNTNRSCSIEKDIKADSKQVFTSADSYELAYDNSHFMEAFFDVLNTNQNDCVPIEEVATEVKSVLKSRGLHTPQFGIIPGYKDSNGTFFFIRKDQ